MTIVNDATSCSVTLELSIVLFESSTSRQLCSGITHYDRHLWLSYFFSIGHSYPFLKILFLMVCMSLEKKLKYNENESLHDSMEQ